MPRGAGRQPSGFDMYLNNLSQVAVILTFRLLSQGWPETK